MFLDISISLDYHCCILWNVERMLFDISSSLDHHCCIFRHIERFFLKILFRLNNYGCIFMNVQRMLFKTFIGLDNLSHTFFNKNSMIDLLLHVWTRCQLFATVKLTSKVDIIARVDALRRKVLLRIYLAPLWYTLSYRLCIRSKTIWPLGIFHLIVCFLVLPRWNCRVYLGLFIMNSCSTGSMRLFIWRFQWLVRIIRSVTRWCKMLLIASLRQWWSQILIGICVLHLHWLI